MVAGTWLSFYERHWEQSLDALEDLLDPAKADRAPPTGTPAASRPDGRPCSMRSGRGCRVSAPMEASVDKLTLYVCDGDDGGPRMHPCRRVQEALRAAGIEYDKVVAAPGSPFPFLRKGSRDELQAATGSKKLPALKLSDGTVITNSRAILAWIKQRG
jgi:hypothetical protein